MNENVLSAVEGEISGWVSGLEDPVAGASRLLITAGTSPSHRGQLWHVHSDPCMKYMCALQQHGRHSAGLLGEE